MKPISNTFQSYDLAEDEARNGAILTSLNIAVLQNLRTNIAEEKLNLIFTPNDVLSYTQQEAFLKGQLDILSFLINSSIESQQSHTL